MSNIESKNVSKIKKDNREFAERGWTHYEKNGFSQFDNESLYSLAKNLNFEYDTAFVLITLLTFNSEMYNKNHMEHFYLSPTLISKKTGISKYIIARKCIPHLKEKGYIYINDFGNKWIYSLKPNIIKGEEYKKQKEQEKLCKKSKNTKTEVKLNI